MSGNTASAPTLPTGVEFRRPDLADGRAMWQMARDSKVLDTNSPYAYLLWCRDFAETSIIAVVDGEPAGFVTGYVRPDRSDTLMVWQVAVDGGYRGRGLASAMLHRLVDRLSDRKVTRLETTITADNEASVRLFSSFAAARGARLTRTPVFDRELFPEQHETELLFEIGPVG